MGCHRRKKKRTSHDDVYIYVIIIHGFMDSWIHGFVDSWIHGFVDSWIRQYWQNNRIIINIVLHDASTIDKMIIPYSNV